MPTLLANLSAVWHLSSMRTWGIVIATTLAATAAPATAQFAPGLHLYAAPAGTRWNRVPAIGDDGRTVAGEVYRASTASREGFALQGDGVIQLLAGTPRVYDVSDNGAYTVGYSTRRAADGTTIALVSNTQPANSSIGAHISGDGQTVAGTAEFTSGQTITSSSAWRWTATGGTTALGPYRPNSLITNALNISRDGSTIVGTGSDAVFGTRTEAWMWREGQGYTVLPDAPGARWIEAEARGVNSDGSIIVGKGNDAQGRIQALVWNGGVPTAIPATGSYESVTAHGLSSNGALLVGVLADSTESLPTTAAIWTQSTNWVPALDYLRAQGLTIPSYYSTLSIQVSADGTTFTSFLEDSRSSTAVLMVAVVPGPMSLAPLGILSLARRRARA